jgi:hypothetical protein
MGKRGRPTGHKLSEESKRAIAESKRGQKHKPETKDKISRSLLIHFKQFNSLGEEIQRRYCRVDNDEICQWANDMKDELDSIEDVFTSKTMRNTRRMELTSGNHIEFYSHDVTPESLMILKEELEVSDPEGEEILRNLV